MTLDTAVLADLAAKATPGPWRWVEAYAWPDGWNGDQTEGDLLTDGGRGLYDDPPLVIEPTGYEREHIRLTEATAAYIAAFSPDVAAALLAEVETLRKALRDIVDLPTVVPDHGHGGVNPPYLEWSRVAALSRAALVSEEGSR